MSKEFISVCLNKATGTHEVVWNGYLKCLDARVYIVDNDYDFGSIDPTDVAIEMYKDNLLSQPGVKLKVTY